MGNMAYCRFRNTLSDLRDCEECLDDQDLSAEEERARRRLIELCKRIASYYEEED